MKLLFFFCISSLLFLWACNKSTDEIKEGDKAKIAVANFVMNGPPINVSISNELLTTAPLNYGEISGTSDSSIYLSFTPGFSNVKLSVAGSDSNLLGPKNNFVFGNVPSSFFLYGKNDTAYTYIVQDIMQPADTIGKARFFNFIPGSNKDSLNVYLIRYLVINNRYDTIWLAKTRVYQPYERYDNSGFNTNIPPDSFHVHVYNRSKFIDSSSYIGINRNKVYSLFAIGAYDGTGANAPKIKVIQHN